MEQSAWTVMSAIWYNITGELATLPIGNAIAPFTNVLSAIWYTLTVELWSLPVWGYLSRGATSILASFPAPYVTVALYILVSLLIYGTFMLVIRLPAIVLSYLWSCLCGCCCRSSREDTHVCTTRCPKEREPIRSRSRRPHDD